MLFKNKFFDCTLQMRKSGSISNEREEAATANLVKYLLYHAFGWGILLYLVLLIVSLIHFFP